MAQRVQVVCCVECKTYQGQIVKKSKKWVCKSCNTKQSVLRVFHEGLGSECRSVVQALNVARGQQVESEQNLRTEEVAFFSSQSVQRDSSNNLENHAQGRQYDNEGRVAQNLTSVSGVPVVPENKSRWTKFCNESESNEFLFD